MTIQFSHPGGKARIRETLYQFFPESGRKYLEPFAGRGNVFFEWYKRSTFTSYQLNDLNYATFFTALKQADLTQLPFEVNEFNFEVWQNRWLASDPIAHILEPKITFRGKGYPAGYGDKHYNKGNYQNICSQAQEILKDSRIIISRSDWAHLDYDNLNEEDFVYLDPPYYKTSGVGYGNIDHTELLARLSEVNFRWVLSGYESDLYYVWLGEPALKLERPHEMCTDFGATTMECIWTNG